MGYLKYKILSYKLMKKMARVICNPWKKTFTLVPQAPLTMISPHVALKSCHVHMSFVKF